MKCEVNWTEGDEGCEAGTAGASADFPDLFVAQSHSQKAAFVEQPPIRPRVQKSPE